MARPKPTILANCTDPKTYADCNILSVECYYAVVYDGRLFQLRKTQFSHKYRKPTLVSLASAENMKNKLNKLFHTDRFSIVKMFAVPLVAPPVKLNDDDDYGEDHDYRRLG